MNKTLSLLFLFLSFSFTTSAQTTKIDSLIIEYQNQTIDTLRIKALVNICNYYYFRKPEKGFIYADTLAELGEKTGQKKYISIGYKFRGNSFVRKGKFQEAIIEFKKGIELQDSIGEEKYKYASYMNMGTAYRYARDFVNANIYYNKAINIATSYDKKDRLIIIYNNLGSMAQSQEQYEIAIGFFLKALESEKYNSNHKRSISPYVNLGTIHYDLNQFEKALEYSNKALKISEKENYLVGIADSKKNIGKIFVAQKNNTEDAIKKLIDAITIYTEVNDYVFLLEAYSALGQAYENIDDLDNAIKFHSKAVILSQEIEMQDNVFGSRVALARALIQKGNLKKAKTELAYVLKDTTNENLLNSHLLVAFKSQSKLSQLSRNYKDALKYHQLYKNLSDEILSAEIINDINELETKYQTEKKEKENLQLKKEKAEQALVLEKESQRKWIFGVLALLAFLTIIFVVFYSKNRRQKQLYKSQLDIAKAKQMEHQRIATDLHDFKVKDLEEIKSELDKYGKPLLANKVEVVKEGIRNLSKQISKIPFDESEFDDQIVTLLASYATKNISTHQKGVKSINWKSVDDTIKQHLFLVIREGFSNAYNHSKAKNIKLYFQKTENHLNISITDDGKGFENATPGLGFTNMKMRINEINGKIKIESEKGAGTHIGIYLTLV